MNALKIAKFYFALNKIGDALIMGELTEADVSADSGFTSLLKRSNGHRDYANFHQMATVIRQAVLNGAVDADSATESLKGIHNRIHENRRFVRTVAKNN